MMMITSVLVVMGALVVATVHAAIANRRLRDGSVADVATQYFSLGWAADYFYVRGHIAATCSSNNQAQFVNLSSMTAIPTIQFPESVTYGNHQCYLELAGDFVLVSTSEYGLQSYSLINQGLVWSNPMTGNNAWAPCYDPHRDHVYVVTQQGVLLAFNVITGANLWNITGYKFVDRPTLLGDNGGTLAVGGADGTLYDFDMSDRSLSWSFSDMHPYAADQLAIRFTKYLDNALILTKMTSSSSSSPSYGLASADYSFGSVNWKVPLGAAPPTPSVGGNDIMFTQSDFGVWSYNGTSVVQLSLDDGSTTSTAPFPDGITTGGGLVNFADTYIVSQSGTGVLAFYDVNDGSYVGNVTLTSAVQTACPWGSKYVALVDAQIAILSLTD